MTITNDTGTALPPIEPGATLAARLWAASRQPGRDRPGVAGPAVLNLWADEAALLRGVLNGYLDELVVEIVASDDPVRRGDLRGDEDLVRALLERLP
jgi:hypothetical protein